MQFNLLTRISILTHSTKSEVMCKIKCIHLRTLRTSSVLFLFTFDMTAFSV